MKPCDYCRADTDNARFICRNCVNACRNRLDELADAWLDSDTALAQQTSYGTAGGNGTATTLPFNVLVSERREETARLLRAWAADINHGHVSQWEDTPLGWIAAIRRRIPDIAHYPRAGDMLDEITDTLHRLTQAGDRPPDRVYAGQCDVCKADLTAPLDADDAICPHCDLVINFRARKQARIDEALDMWLTPSEIITALPAVFGTHMSEAKLNRWSRQRRLKANEVGRYRVDDVLRLVQEEAATRRTHSA